MAKITDEDKNNFKKNLEYLGLNLEKIPKALLDFEELGFSPSNTFNDTEHKVFKYVPIDEIYILLTPTNRLNDVKEKYGRAKPIAAYLDPENIEEYANIAVIDNFLTLTKVENTGAFLSIGNNLPDSLRIIILNIFPLLVIGFGLYYLFTEKNLNLWTQAGFCLLLGGGLGNVYDRIKFGSVTDFLHLDFGFAQTGVFNVADMFIMAGIGILFIHTFKKENKVQPEA